jgi:predicted ATPase
MRRDLPSGIVTFLFTDVEGSTKLLHDLGAEEYAVELGDHRRLVREACAEHDGVEVDTQGDAFFIAFPSAPEAVAAAQAVTVALAAGRIHVRMGLHTGRPLVTDEGYVGDDVHFAARVAATGHGGQVVLSKATAALVEAELTDLGEHRLKDIEQPVAIYQLGPERFPPLKTISNTNLPRPASSFVGREKELAEVLSRIEQGAHLLTLTGPGGSGKTRLALEAAATLVPEYKAGVFWVGLASLRDPALVSEQIAQTLGAKDGLAAHVGDRELLLLLDNLEQVVDAAPELSRLLQSCPNLTLLCTSRELLRVQGEVEYSVPPLAFEEAISLFCERAQLEASDAVAELCARLDNLPLAVELAAARTKVLTPTQILERLSERLDVLKGGRDADPRQQTLRATIAWSYDLLSGEEQRLFRALSIFSGGCTVEAAEQIADAEIDTLQSLVEKSLLRFSNSRYWMLETIREYAREKLEQAGETRELVPRHAAFFADSAESHGRELMYGQELGAPVRWFSREHDNLRAALDAEAAVGVRLRLLHAVRNYWEGRGFGREYRAWIEAAVAESDSLPPLERARAYANAGWIANAQQDPEATVSYHERALALYESLGDEEGVARALVGVGRGLRKLGRAMAARQYFERGLRAARRASSAPVIAGASSELAFLALEEGDLKRARRFADELRAVDIGDAPFAPFIEGLIALETGDVSAARTLLSENVRTIHAAGLHSWIPADIDAFAAALAASGDAERASELIGQAETLRESFGVKPDRYAQSLREGVVQTARSTLGDDVFRAAKARGAAMKLEDVITAALASLD